MPRTTRTTATDENSSDAPAPRPRRARAPTSRRSPSTSDTTAVRTPRRSTRATTRVQNPNKIAEARVVTPRRAPSAITSSTQGKAAWKTYRVPMAVAALFMVGIGASALVGFTDSGKIDVQATLRLQEERARAAAIAAARAAGESVDTIPDVPTTPPVVQPANLRPRGVGSPTAASPQELATMAVATTSVQAGAASSSDALEQSTDDVVSNENDESTDTESGRDPDETLSDSGAGDTTMGAIE